MRTSLKFACLYSCFVPVYAFASAAQNFEKIECGYSKDNPVHRLLLDKKNFNVFYADEDWEIITGFFVSKFRCRTEANEDFVCDANYYPFLDTFVDSPKSGMSFTSITYKFPISKIIDFQCFKIEPQV